MTMYDRQHDSKKLKSSKKSKQRQKMGGIMDQVLSLLKEKNHEI